MKNNKVAVTSRSFSQNTVLRDALLARFSHVSFNDSGKTLSGNELIAFMKDHAMAIVGLERFSKDVITALPSLKVISRFGVGTDTLDVAELKRREIRIAVTAGANKRAVAELVLAFAIMMLRYLPLANQTTRAGAWKPYRGRELTGKTVGILGYGAIGRELAHMLQVFNCKILTYDINNDLLTLDALLRNADVVSVHLPLNAGTQLLLNAERLALLKANAVLINTSRGGIIDEHAVKCMLKSERLAGAAFDVFTSEPPSDQELIALPNFFATPHIAGTTEEAVLAMGFAAIAGLDTH